MILGTKNGWSVVALKRRLLRGFGLAYCLPNMRDVIAVLTRVSQWNVGNEPWRYAFEQACPLIATKVRTDLLQSIVIRFTYHLFLSCGSGLTSRVILGYARRHVFARLRLFFFFLLLVLMQIRHPGYQGLRVTSSSWSRKEVIWK